MSRNVHDYSWLFNVMISIFARKLLGVVSVILSSNSSSKSKVSTLVELCVPYSHLGFLWVRKWPCLSLSVNIMISIFNTQLLGLVSVILSSNGSSKSKVSTFIEFEKIWFIESHWKSLKVPKSQWKFQSKLRVPDCFRLSLIVPECAWKSLKVLTNGQLGTIRDNKNHSGTLDNIQGHSGTFWDILQHSATLYNILQYSGTFWDIWDILGHSGTCNSKTVPGAMAEYSTTQSLLQQRQHQQQ